MSYGVVYIAHNPRDGSSTFKVGMTERPVNERMKELTAATSNIGEYSAIAYFVVSDAMAAESACHRRLANYRVQENREFFELPLDLLLTMIKEGIEPFKATDLIPQIGENVTPPTPRSLSERLASTRDADSEAKLEWERVFREKTAKMASVVKEVQDYANAIQQELANEPSLRCGIRSEAIPNEHWSKRGEVCRFSIYAQIDTQPIVLRRHGLRGDIYGELDLSRAVPGSVETRTSTIDNKKQGYEFVEWKEADDGLVGFVSVIVKLVNASDAHKERNQLSEVSIRVHGSAWRYDDYREDFKSHDDWKEFRDPREAMDVVSEIVLNNLADPQTNVRTREGTYKSRRGTREKIVDRGKFDLTQLRPY